MMIKISVLQRVGKKQKMSEASPKEKDKDTLCAWSGIHCCLQENTLEIVLEVWCVCQQYQCKYTSKIPVRSKSRVPLSSLICSKISVHCTCELLLKIMAVLAKVGMLSDQLPQLLYSSHKLRAGFLTCRVCTVHVYTARWPIEINNGSPRIQSGCTP